MNVMKYIHHKLCNLRTEIDLKRFDDASNTALKLGKFVWTGELKGLMKAGLDAKLITQDEYDIVAKLIWDKS